MPSSSVRRRTNSLNSEQLKSEIGIRIALQVAARPGCLLSRLVLIVIVSEGANSRLPAARDRPRERETTNMATHYPLEGTSPRPRTVAADGPVIRHIGFSDLLDALRLGWEDFKAVPSHAIVLCVIYPVIGILLWRMVLGYSVLPMLFPLAAGFALIGPFAALGLYELSYRRELGHGGVRLARVPRAAGTVVRIDAWTGRAAACHFRRLGGNGARDLRVHLRQRPGIGNSRFPHAGFHHVRGLAPDHDRLSASDSCSQPSPCASALCRSR